MAPPAVAPFLLLALALGTAQAGVSQWRAAYPGPLLRPGPASPSRSHAAAGPRSPGRLAVGGLLGATAGFGVAMRLLLIPPAQITGAILVERASAH